MNNTKIIMILKHLSDDELKEFGRLTLSPFFNRLNDVSRLFNILKKYHPEYPEDSVDKHKIYNKLFPGKPYSDTRMRNLVSDLGQLAEKYLFHLSCNENNYYSDIIYLNFILSRGMLPLFEKTYKKLSQNQNDEVFDPHFRIYLMESLLHDYYLYTNRQHKAAESLYKTYDSLAGFYLDTMVRGIYSFKVQKNMHDNEKTSSLLREFVSSFDFKRFRDRAGFAEEKDFIFINIQYYFFELLEGNDFENNFNDLLNYVSENESKASMQLMNATYQNLNNVLAFRIYEEELDYSKHRLRVLKEIISKNFRDSLKKEPFLLAMIYITAVNLAFETGENSYAEELYENHLHKTQPENRDSLDFYTKAYIEFSKGNFEKSLELINKVSYDVVPLRRHVKNMTLLLYYELGHFDSAEAYIASYRQYMKRASGFKGMYGPWYENFLKFYGELLNLKFNSAETHGKNDVNDLMMRISSEGKVLFKNWLVEKTVSLLKD